MPLRSIGVGQINSISTENHFNTTNYDTRTGQYSYGNASVRYQLSLTVESIDDEFFASIHRGFAIDSYGNIYPFEDVQVVEAIKNKVRVDESDNVQYRELEF